SPVAHRPTPGSVDESHRTPDLIACAGERRIEFVNVAGRLVAPGWPLVDGDLVVHRAAAHRVLHQVHPGTDPQRDFVTGYLTWDVVYCDRAAVGDVAAEGRGAVIEQVPHLRPDTVRADEQSSSVGLVVGEVDLGGVGSLPGGDDGAVVLQHDVRFGAAGGQEDI